ncbi:MAG: tetratricopeptide repeat protein [bacterium]
MKGKLLVTGMALLTVTAAAGCARNHSTINRGSDDSTAPVSPQEDSHAKISLARKKWLEELEGKVDKTGHHVGELVSAMAKYKDVMDSSQAFINGYRKKLDQYNKGIADLKAGQEVLKREMERLKTTSLQLASKERLNHMEDYIEVVNEKLAGILKMEKEGNLLETLKKSDTGTEANKRRIKEIGDRLDLLAKYLSDKVDMMAGRTGKLAGQAKQVSADINRLQAIQRKLTADQQELNTGQKTLIAKVERKETAAGKISEKALYDSANRLYVNREYTDSIVLFSRFVETFPQSGLADNAQYWIGMGYFSQNNYSRAADEFKKVIQGKFTDNSARVDALFKLGDSFMKLRKKKEAMTAFKRVIKEASGNKRYFLLTEGAQEYLAELESAL